MNLACTHNRARSRVGVYMLNKQINKRMENERMNICMNDEDRHYSAVNLLELAHDRER